MEGGLFAALAPAHRFYPLFVALALSLLGLRIGLRRAWGAAAWRRRVQALERLVLASLILSMLALAVLQILLRNLFHSGLIWIDPLLRHFVLWIGFSGAVVAAGRLRHIQMDVVGRWLPEGPRRAILRATTLAAALICLVLTRAAWIFLGQEHAFGSAGLLGLPQWILMSAIFLGFALCAVRFAARAFAPGEELAGLLLESSPADGLDGLSPAEDLHGPAPARSAGEGPPAGGGAP
ncbi:MAG: TRAP transporter small permease [Candidatus Eisenbacteria bacterium]|uniref:TRAP transporter small permease n=1 Tax=Eiseniibacteriota bacterium TaxID=2212470 RepID=A0A937XDA0_UNCEI|nr:TRAP transporter small permease [Candidatus Eisenbacteria bacterium]